MKKTEYPIVVIDEEKDQLDEMQAALRSVGKNCTAIQYDSMYSVTGEPYSGIELLFLDMNLNPAPGQNENALYSILEDAITSYISKDNGPFVLVFWTSRAELVNGFKTYVDRGNKNSPINSIRPIYLELLPKEDFFAQPQIALNAILSKPIINLVFSLQENLQTASQKAFNEIIGCVKPSENWGDNDTYILELKKVFTKIAVSSVGKGNATSIPDKAIMEVVGQEVYHHLIKNCNDEWKAFLEIDEEKADSVRKIVNEAWQYKLNTVFHVDQDGRKTDRGAVLTGRQCKFELLIGRNLTDWYKEEFGLVQDKKDKSSYLPVAVEISPACDYAQGNARLYKYILGLCRLSEDQPSKSMESGETNPFKKSKLNHLSLPTFLIREKYYKMVLSFNYIIGLRDCFAERLDYLFSLRDSIVTKVNSDSSDFCSRIGIININEI